MKDAFKAVKVTDKVYWVGAIDWAVRDFHGYLTSRGTTYNAYLVLSEKVTLMDTVKSGFADEMFARIASVIDPRRIDYIVSNHSEPDHAGSLAGVIKAIEPEQVFASKMGVKALGENFGIENVQAVADGQELSLGDRKLTAVETRMCHWPDSMVSYLHEDKLLFSQDAFGMHLAGYERFADEMDEPLLASEAGKYYANILLPLSASVTKAVAKLTELGIPLEIIAPDHGPIWRRDTGRIVSDYARWARQERTDKAVVVYDTMWSSTERMARAIGEGLAAGGTRTRLMSMHGCHRSDVATEMLDAGALLVGAPTINNQIFPTVADVMTYLKGLRPLGVIGAAFGSYGWGGGAGRGLRSMLEEMHVEPIDGALDVVYAPTDEQLLRCYEFGQRVSAELKKRWG